MTGCASCTPPRSRADALLRRALAPLVLLPGLAGAPAQAASLHFCTPDSTLSAAQKDKLLQFGAVIKDELERSGATLALVARSGLNLARFDIRYSHAGLSLRANPETPWAVRQLYYACDEGQPRLFDQGLAAFLMGTDEPALGYISALVLPREAAEALERAALDNPLALSLLAGSYSANAHPYGLRHQNCNQWLLELLAMAWGARMRNAAPPPPEASTAATPSPSARTTAQDWLRTQGYEASVVQVGWLMGLGDFIPWVHRDDHPAEDIEARRYRVSLPESIATFVRTLWPATQRLEFCHDSKQVVVRRGWQPIADACRPAPQDRVIPLT